MIKNLIRNALFILAALLLFAPASWAKAKGYCYIVGYSFAEKKAFFSPILIQDVNSKSYSNEEFVTDVELIQRMESQFQARLKRISKLDISRFTISARGAFKSNAIADNKYKDEMGRFVNRGYVVKVVNDFKFSD